jgi:formylglycine-generating enzyme required for sulfatase activity
MEWSFACEGPEGLAFGYGDTREDERCNTGREAVPLRPEELWEPRDVVRALARADQRTPSGARERCSTPFALHDLIGNVEEWVTSDVAGVEAALRGGSYSSAESVCRSVRVIRQAGFREVHTGFRCCRDPLLGPPRTSPSSG